MNPRFQNTSTTVVFRLDARVVADAGGTLASPGSVLLRFRGSGAEVLAAGAPSVVDAHTAARGATRVVLPRSVLLPGFVNSHTHLDLTHVGPRDFDPADGFDSWLAMILRERATTPEAIGASVRRGVELSLAGGVVAVGDIAGTGRLEAAHALLDSPLYGATFVEFFGLGDAQEPSLASAADALESLRHRTGGRVRIGLSPHAPYTAGGRLYEGMAELCARAGAPIATHLAESVEEREYVADGAGPMLDLLRRYGLWSDAAAIEVGAGRHPIAHLAPVLRRTQFLLAHVNDCPDDMLPILASTGASVAWCPRGWAYFGRDVAVGPHNWRGMLGAGVNVALGTDSIVIVPRDEADRLSTLDEARRLRRMEGVDSALLLRMITTNGGRALRLEEGLFTFAPGPIAGVVAVECSDAFAGADALAAVFDGAGAPDLLCIGGAVGDRLAHGAAR